MTIAEFNAAAQTISVKDRVSMYLTILLGLNDRGAL